MASDSARRDRSQWTVRRFSSSVEADKHDLEYWMQIPENERMLQEWRLSEDQYRLAGKFPDESALCRSVESVRRR
jgi:hypothetical protein